MSRAILTFHSIDDSRSVLSFPPHRFAALLRGLSDARVPVLSYPELLSAERGVALSFDDGFRSVHRHALPVLREHRVPSHLFLATAAVGGDNRWPSQPRGSPVFEMLDWREVEACAAGGISIESHTSTHADLLAVDDAAIADECERADSTIERRVGRRPRLFAYPYGRFDARVAAIVGGRYEACFSTRLAYLGRRVDAQAVPRIDAYYLRGGWPGASLLAATGRAYLNARGVVRRLRGMR